MTVALDLPPESTSPLARFDARWKLAALGLAGACAAVLQTLSPAATALAGALILAALGRVPPRWYLARVGPVLIGLILFVVWLPFLLPPQGQVWVLGPLQVSAHGVEAALLLVIKALTILTVALTLVASTPAPLVLRAAHSLRVPGLLVQLTLLTYRYLFVLTDELARLRIALRVRGYRNRASWHSYRTVGHVAGTLLVRSSERADRIGQAMRCRGFDGRFRSLAAFRTAPGDVAFFLATTGTAAGLVAWDWLRQ
jgi:cobalt/nickel transport system permease protein